MKKILLFLLSLFTLVASAQTKSDLNLHDINLRLKKHEEMIQNTDYKLETFRYEHTKGVIFSFSGIGLIGLGSYMNYRYYQKNPGVKGTMPSGFPLVAIGALSCTAGLVITLNSYKNLRLGMYTPESSKPLSETKPKSWWTPR
jgi:hypothetical protein